MWPSMSKTAFTDNSLIICPFCRYPAAGILIDSLLKFQAIIRKQWTARVFFTASLFVLLRMCFTISWLCFSTLLPSPWRPLSPRRTEAWASSCCPTAPCARPTLLAIYSPCWTTGSTVLTWRPRWASQHSPWGGGGRCYVCKPWIFVWNSLSDRFLHLWRPCAMAAAWWWASKDGGCKRRKTETSNVLASLFGFPCTYYRAPRHLELNKGWQCFPRSFSGWYWFKVSQQVSSFLKMKLKVEESRGRIWDGWCNVILHKGCFWELVIVWYESHPQQRVHFPFLME